jgi:hypothetical protein
MSQKLRLMQGLLQRQQTDGSDEDWLSTCLHCGSESGSAIEAAEKGRLPKDLPRKGFRFRSTEADQIRPGDTIVVWKSDRLARSTRDLLNTMEVIHEGGGWF